MLDWLPDDHLVWFVIAAVERLDTLAFHARARLGGVGRRGFDPDMLLTLFVYAMAHGQSSSRRIERLCHTDVAFRVICAQDVPDHTVLARFGEDHEAALADLLTESLVLAAELGMVSLGVVAFDGTKIAANASKDANRGEARLRRLAEEFLTTVAAADEADDALFGEDSRGDEPPAGMGDRTRRGERINQALGQVQARRGAAEQARRERAERARGYEQTAPKGGRPRGADPLVAAKTRLDRERGKAQALLQAWRARAERARAAGGKPVGRPAVPVEEHHRVRKARAACQAALAQHGEAGDTGAGAAAGAAGQTENAGEPPDTFKANLTDPDSRLLKTRNGWIQGYNCQTSASGDEFILTARATQDACDVEQFTPTVNDVVATAAELARRTGRDDLQVGTMIGDAGYDSAANLDADGPDRLIPDAKRRAINQRAATEPAAGDPPEHTTGREQINHRLRTPEGHALYKRRAPMIEAPNAWLKDRRGLRRFTRRGLRRFTRRGLAAAQAELSFASAVTNLLKLATRGVTIAQLQTG
ncbi:MAG: DDE transposase [Micromonosporaceae bacterium]|nr:DDE transposase [Micromonosporaceae bacterium]